MDLRPYGRSGKACGSLWPPSPADQGPGHRERAALEIHFSDDELEQLDAIFPPPFHKVMLGML